MRFSKEIEAIYFRNRAHTRVKLAEATLEFQTGEETLLKTADVARRMGVTESWVRDHVSRVEPIIPHVKIGALVRFRKQDLDAFIAAQVKSTPTWARTI